MYIGYIDHLKEHQDKVIKCKTCGKVCKSLFALRQHIKKHVNQCPFCTENFSKSQELMSHMEEDHGEEPRVIERQCPYCDATFESIKEVTKHSQNVHRPHCCNICFMRFSEEHKLIEHQQKVHKISNLGANVIISEPKKPSDQPLGLSTDTGDGAETSRPEMGDPSNQMPGPWEQDKPQVSSEPATPKKDKVLKGNKKESEWYKVKCEACNRYFASIEERRNHIKAYHQNRLKECTYCNKKYMEPWDFNTHLDNKHVWCEPCQGYVKNQQTCEAHYRAKHDQQSKTTEEEPREEPMPTPQAEPEQEQDTSQSQVSEEQATPKTGHNNCPHKCKYCGKGFKMAPQVNVHTNRKHRTILCTNCDKYFVTEQGRDNHRADVHKYPRFHCKVKKCGVYAHTPEELHRHMRAEHWEKLPFRCSIVHTSSQKGKA